MNLVYGSPSPQIRIDMVRNHDCSVVSTHKNRYYARQEKGDNDHETFYCEVQRRQMVRDMRLVDRCCRALHALGTADALLKGNFYRDQPMSVAR